MGHETILVIGDKFLDQLGNFQLMEYAHPLSPQIVSVNILSKAKEKFKKCLDADESSFPDWIKKYYGVAVLFEGQQPDFEKVHRFGWVRLDADGQVYEIFERTISEGFFDWFEGTLSYWKLKPGAEGIDVSLAEEFSVTTGFAGSAKKSAIELARMWQIIESCAGERWDHAMAACGFQTWEAFDIVWDKYKAEKYSDELHRAAKAEWAEQPAVKAILAMPCPDEVLSQELFETEREMRSRLWMYLGHCGIDILRLSRDKYINSYDLGHLLGYSVIIKDGVLLKDPDERALFAGLADDTLLTIAYVHS
ncbi:hypothetical protein ACO0LC_10700 [Undibacterium sp. JH2W]|uniref:hypothetical protein n=1 Tax=Undibacterium sp. JH2W TaxID=3413037 RepID=UPI003BF03283